MRKFAKKILQPVWSRIEDRIEDRIEKKLNSIAKQIPMILVCDFLRAEEFLDLLAPMSMKDHSLIRVGPNYDGGYIMVNDKLDNNVVYNFGIGEEVNWDLGLTMRGSTIFQYDHTIEKPPLTNNNMRFFKLGLSPILCDDKKMKTIEELLIENGHENKTDMILNIDIEGGEWDVLSSISPDILSRFYQIIIEYHFLYSIVNKEIGEKYIRALKNINKSHQVVHVHGNNYGPNAILNNFTYLPTYIEVTYVKKTGINFEICDEIFPRSIDKPNKPGTYDYALGPIGLTWKKQK